MHLSTWYNRFSHVCNGSMYNLFIYPGGLSSEAVPDSEISTVECEEYDAKDPPCEGADCLRRKTCEGSPKAYCFASWRNDTDGFKFIMKGCWSSDENCVNSSECIQSPSIKNLNFCCCQEPMCNTVVKSVHYTTTLPPKTTGKLHYENTPMQYTEIFFIYKK